MQNNNQSVDILGLFTTEAAQILQKGDLDAMLQHVNDMIDSAFIYGAPSYSRKAFRAWDVEDRHCILKICKSVAKLLEIAKKEQGLLSKMQISRDASLYIDSIFEDECVFNNTKYLDYLEDLILVHIHFRFLEIGTDTNEENTFLAYCTYRNIKCIVAGYLKPGKHSYYHYSEAS